MHTAIQLLQHTELRNSNLFCIETLCVLRTQKRIGRKIMVSRPVEGL